MSREESFRAAMSAQGIGYGGELYFDGKLHRFKAGDDKARNSWYVLYSGPPAAGAFGCWKRGINEKWCERNGNLSQAEMQRVRQRWLEIKRQQKKLEGDRQKKAREIADWIFKRATLVQSHAYLSAKGVRPLGELRESYRGELLLPLRDINGHLHSLQFIAPDDRYDGGRNKNFLASGRTKGCFYTLFDKADGPLVICEGYATGASIHEATGHAVICAMNSGNLSEVAKAARELWLQREIIVAADNDQFTEDNPGQTKAAAAAKAIAARLAVPQFKELTAQPTDFNDLAVLETLAAVREQLSATQVPKETNADTFARLATLEKEDYEMVREAEARRLGFRVSVLDELVYEKRPRANSGGGGENLQGIAVKLVDVEPWPEPVNGDEVLDAIAKSFENYVVLPEGVADMLALWCTHTHLFKLFQKSPRLYISAPTEECGKSTLLNCCSLFCARAKRADNMTTAVMFRLVAGHSPTILADECDKWLFTNGELVGLVQSGAEKGGTVMRCEGDSNDLREFGCYAPFALAAIGKLPSQLHSRSICARLKRASREEIRKRSPFDLEHVEDETELKRKLARWIADNRDRIASCKPKLPEQLFNRIADNWRPLFKIAEIAGSDWPQRCASALIKLTTRENERENLRVMVLADIQKVFTGEWPPPREGISPLPVESVFTKDLLEKLVEMKDRPWPEICHGKPITARWLASNLAAFDIHSKNIRIDEDQAKGYERAQFDDAFARYIPETLEGGKTAVPPSHTEVKPEILSVPEQTVGTDGKRPIHEASGRWDGSATGEGPRKGESDAETLVCTEAEAVAASIPVMLTKKMETDLRRMGYSQAAINKMTPGQAHLIISSSPGSKAVSGDLKL